MQDYKLLLEEINKICNNKITPNPTSICTRENYFLDYFNNNDFFRKQSLEKIKRVYETYKSNKIDLKNLIEVIMALFYNNWNGAYSELCAYDLLNLSFEKPCKIQVDDLKKENTLAQFYKNRERTTIDGYIEDALVFFEIKSLTDTTLCQIQKLKNEIDKKGTFSITIEYPSDGDLKDYAGLKKEILQASAKKEKFFSSRTNPKFNVKLYYAPSIKMKMHACESAYQMAERLEKLPLEKAYQFVNGRFIKIFVCNGLNIHNNIICNEVFFRALARRVFCKLTKDTSLINEDCSLSVADVAQKLSGILFIVDLSANNDTSKILDNPKKLYNAYLYVNPNADFNHSLLSAHNFAYALNEVNKKDIDDFQFDNY